MMGGRKKEKRQLKFKIEASRKPKTMETPHTRSKATWVTVTGKAKCKQILKFKWALEIALKFQWTTWHQRHAVF